MNSGINLLGNKKKVTVSPAVRRLWLLRSIAMGVLSIVAFASMVLFLLIAFSPLPALQKQEQIALQTIAQYHPDIAKMQFVNDRLNGSAEILGKRNNFDQLLSSVQAKMPPDLVITALTMKQGETSVTVTTSSLESLNTFIDNLVKSVEEKKDFSKVTLISLMDDGAHSFSLTVDLTTL